MWLRIFVRISPHPSSARDIFPGGNSPKWSTSIQVTCLQILHLVNISQLQCISLDSLVTQTVVSSPSSRSTRTLFPSVACSVFIRQISLSISSLENSGEVFIVLLLLIATGQNSYYHAMDITYCCPVLEKY